MRYTIQDYKLEMLSYQGSMPRGWITKLVAERFPERDEKSKKKLHREIRRVFDGLSYRKGIKENLINLIREAHSQYNNTELKILPQNVYTI